MRLITIVTLLLLVSTVGFSQDYMAAITSNACSCLEKIPDDIEDQEATMKLGLCMIEAALPYKKQIKKEYNINLDNIDEEGEELGKIIALKMMGVCPDNLIKLSMRIKGMNDQSASEQTIEGVITKVEGDFFVIFSLKDESGKISKYFWLTTVESEFDLPSAYQEMTGKSVKITYEAQDMFDPRINEYRAFLILKAITLK